MNTLDVIRITALTATLFNLILTILVLSRDFRSTLHRVYLGWGISVTLWNLGVFHLSQPISHQEAFAWAKVLQLGVIFMPVTLFHLCVIISKARVGRLVPILYLIHAGFAVSLFFNKFIVSVRLLDVGYWSVPGPGFIAFSCSYCAVTTSLVWILYREQKTAPPTQRTRLRSLLLAIVGLWVFGTNDMLPILGHDTYPLTHIKFYPLGSLAAVFYVVIIGYSVLQHRLLDIQVTLSRFAAQSVRLLFMMLVGFLLLLLISRLAPNQFTLFSFVAAGGVLFVTALAATFLFPQFFGKGTDTLERRILGDKFEYHARVQNLIQTMRSFPDPDFLLHELEELLAGTMRVRSYQIILLDDTTRGFKLFHCHPARPEGALPDIQADSPVCRYFQRTRAKFLSCNLVYETDSESLLQREARRQLRPFEPEFCFPFFVSNDLIGTMLLGPKANGDFFTPHDVRLLTELTSNLGLLLNQIRLRHQLQAVHEQDLLGRMSRGLAHDLNNLLTPVQTLLQLFREAKLNQDTIDELLPMSLRNLETVRTYVNEALFFSRSAKLHGKLGLLGQVVREAISLVTPEGEEKAIRIVFEPKTEAAIEMDAVLIKRLLCNLFSNAVHASPSGSEIEVELALLPKTESNRDWYRLKVIDHGEGISPENLRRVFTPYFTTKNTGDGKRGSGLGLAIARHIVHLHGGNLSIVSKEKKGTTVQVDLPSKLNQGQAPASLPARGRFEVAA
ncbi:MAG TPA: ATP-binding protein [Candidatus Baltobacteraceae bacterium]|jgi:signal transduction histidine kinase|nr:ATP-binding protein [Candidatus Baltobacteraceae bacterium]